MLTAVSASVWELESALRMPALSELVSAEVG
jgi:hypothetical protein